MYNCSLDLVNNKNKKNNNNNTTRRDILLRKGIKGKVHE